MTASVWFKNGEKQKIKKPKQEENFMENTFNEDVKGNTAFSNPYDDSNWDGE